MKVYIRNFRCFENKELEFPIGKISLLKGESGKGKSTTLEAIRWALFGNMRNIYPMGFKPSSSNQTIVMLDFPNLKLRRIERSQPPENLKVYIVKDTYSEGEIPYEILESEAAQRYIESVFSTKDIWAISSYLAQGDRCPLMTQSNADKMNLLCEILFGNKIDLSGNDFQNPDFYSNKIETELNEISSKLALETANYNLNYGKYMEAIQTYKPNPDAPNAWTSLPSLEDLTSLETSIQTLKNSIQDITKHLVEVKGKETEKEFLNSRLQELQEKIKRFEEMNNSEMSSYLQNTREQISGLETSLQDLQTLYLKTLANEQSKEMFQKQLEEVLQSLSEIPEAVRSLDSQDIENRIIDSTSKKQKYESEILRIKQLEGERDMLSGKIKVSENEIASMNLHLDKFPEEDLDQIRILLQNTRSAMKLQEIQKREPENVSFSYSEEEIQEMLRSLPVFIAESTLNEDICVKFKLCEKGSPITPQVEAVITQHLSSIQQVLTFVETMRKELELSELHKKSDNRIISLTSEIENLRSELIEKEKEISETPLLDLEQYITKKTEIQLNIGDSLSCPECHSSLEMNHSSSGPKLCKISRVRYTLEEGKKKIDLLNKLSELLKNLKEKEAELEFIRKEKSELAVPRPEYISEQVRQTYTEEVIQKYKSFFDEVSKVKFGVKNEFAKSSLEAEDLLQKIPKVQIRRRWEEELRQAKETFNVQDNLKILSDAEKELYEEAEKTLPLLLTQKSHTEKVIIEMKEALVKIEQTLQGSHTSEVLESGIQSLQEMIQTLETYKKQSMEYKSLDEKKQKISNEISLILINQSAEMIQEQMQSLKLKIQALKETLSGFSQYEVLTNEYNEVEQKWKGIVLINTSSELQNQLDQNNEKILKLEVRLTDGKSIQSMASLRSELEQAQKNVVELTNQHSTANRLKMLIVEVTNSSLQNLVDSINACTNSILEDLFESDIHLELKLFKENKKTNNVKPQINFSLEYKHNTYDSIVGLSGGEKDRISLALTIALACVNPSPVLFLDECMASLNVDLRENCIEAIKKFVTAQTGKTIINIEHSGIDGYYDDVITM